ncbi:serine/threonine-protein kinase PknK [Chondromyces crocatus]|nr:serine/threonine-protein kinase [Chondromyces crocatus]
MAKHPSQLADLEIIRRIGAGGMAEVFLSKKRGAEGTYKLLVAKRILPAHGASRRFRAMFVEEAHLATRLNHPNIVQVYEFSDHGDDGLLLLMEYVEGFDLGKLMSSAKQKGTKVPPYVAAFLVAEAAKGLHYAHERKDEGGVPLAIVHRDVSPQNILISFEGVVKIADFGIASANLFREEPGVLKGKFGYMSPEQARGDKVDRRSDIYALGVVLYELLTLRSPYGKIDDEALLEAVKEGTFDPPQLHAPDAPPELAAIVQKAMAHDREGRYQTARDLAGAIARVLLAKQELVDSAAVEQTVAHLLGRDLPEGAVMRGALTHAEGPPDQPRTMAAVPAARTAGTAGTEGTGAQRAVREVRHVAVVTLRLDGLQALESALGPAAAQRTEQSIRALLDDIGFRRGAVWSWQSAATARAVVGLMDNPSRAAFDAASLAIDVHEALAGASDDLPAELRAAMGIVRGIAAGERDKEGRLIHHALQEPANFLAERLGERTPFGRTWVAGGVYRLVRRDFRWSDAPALDLENARDYPVPQQMRLYGLERPLTREERIAEIALAPTDLVGRDAERADLHAAYHRAVSPPIMAPTELASIHDTEDRRSLPPPPGSALRGEFVARALVGEMGIGKTALTAAFLAELPSDARILHVECSPVKQELPLATLSDVLRDITGMGLEHTLEDASSVLRGLLGPAARTPAGTRIVSRLSELVTGKQGDQPDEDAPSYGRDLLLRGVRYLLGALARHQPLVIVIDGLQWSDRQSLDLIQELVRRTDALPILALLLTRPEDRVNPFLEGLVRIELRGLSPEEQTRLVEARLGVREGVAAVCGELLPRASGNPFFLLEMVDALLERGTLEIVERESGVQELRRHERAGDRAEKLPSTLEQLIGDRLRELPPEEQEVVRWLAVAGGPLLAEDLLNLMRLANDEAIVRLCARGLCDRRAGTVDFRHPLTRDVAYLSLDGSTRARMHRRLGEHLSTTPLAQGISAAIVAQHLARGESPGPAAQLYLEAASGARMGHQAQLALRYYQRALKLLPTGDSRRMVAHEALEAIFRHLGKRRERKTHLTALRKLARESGQARWVALAMVRTARLDLDDGHLSRGAPVAQRAAEIARLARRPALEVEALTSLSEILRELGDIPGALSASDRAIRVAHSGELTPRARAEVLRAKGVLLRRVGRVHEAVEAYAEAIAVFRAVGARRSEARAKNALAVAMLVLERFEDSIAVGLSSISIDLAIGGRFQIAKTLSNIGQSYLRLGDMNRALGYLKRAREAHERYDDQDARADTLLCSAWVLLEGGDLDAAHTLVADAGALIAVTGNVYDMVHQRILRSLLARARGDLRAALATSAEARALAEAQGFMSYHAYATAIEAATRADTNDLHAAVLLARTALGAVEAGSSEYGIEIRDLACSVLARGAPASAPDAYHRAALHIRKVASYVRDQRHRELFTARPVVRRILDADRESAEESHVVAPARGRSSGAPGGEWIPGASAAVSSSAPERALSSGGGDPRRGVTGRGAAE